MKYRKGRVIVDDGGFVERYYDSKTGKQLSPKEAHVRMAKFHSDLEKAFGDNGDSERAEMHRYRAEQCERDSRKLSSSVSCFITTACIEAEGLPDDCIVLETLRAFRDGYLANQHGGEDLIQEYYTIAPRIVESISKRPDAREVFCGIFDRDITTAVDMIQKGDNEGTLQHYMNMTNRLKNEFLSNSILT